jgi:nicotinamidase-related amidase
LCDIQEKFVPHIAHVDSVIHVANYLLRANQALKCPLVVTEQYPKGLGKTAPAVVLPDNVTPIEKTMFSMMTPEVRSELDRIEVDNVVLFGIEAHVCILQTAIDLLEAGKEVHVVADGTSSQRQADRMVAFERLRQMGVFVSTSESIVFQLVGNAKDACFKAISELSKEARPDPGLWVAAKV